MTQHPALRNPMFKSLPTRTKIQRFEDLSSTLCFLLHKYDENQYLKKKNSLYAIIVQV